MGPTTVKIDATHLEQLHQLLIKESQASEVRTTNKYEAFRIELAGGLVIAYKTGKIVVNGEKLPLSSKQGLGAHGTRRNKIRLHNRF